MIPSEGAEGALIAMGGDEAGYVLYVKDNKLVYGFNYYSYDHYKVTSTTDVPTGEVELKMDFNYDGGGPGKGGDVTLFINGEQAGQGRIEKTIPGKYGFDEMDIGMDLSGAVMIEEYDAPFKFTGEVEKVTIQIAEDQ